MPRDYAYGQRAWNSGAWIAAASQVSIASATNPNPPAAVPPVPLDYWSTELKENSLMLEGVKYVPSVPSGRKNMYTDSAMRFWETDN